MQQARTIMETRVNGSGVAGAEVQIDGARQLVITVPGNEDLSGLTRSAQLNIRPVLTSPLDAASGQGTPVISYPAGYTPPATAHRQRPPASGETTAPSGDTAVSTVPAIGDTATATAPHGAARLGADDGAGDRRHRDGGRDRPLPAPRPRPRRRVCARRTRRSPRTPAPTARRAGDATPRPPAPPAADTAAASTPAADTAAAGTAATDTAAPTATGTPATGTTAAAPAWPAGSDPANPTQPAGTDQTAWTTWETAATTALPTLSCADLEPYRGLDDPSKPLIACSDAGDAIYLLGPTLIAGTQISTATSGQSQQGAGWVVNLSFKSDGYSTWASYTASHTGTLTAMTLDGQVISAPRISGPITTTTTEISGSFTQASAAALANSLKFGVAAAGVRGRRVGQRQRPARPGIPDGRTHRRRHRPAAGDHLLPDLLPAARRDHHPVAGAVLRAGLRDPGAARAGGSATASTWPASPV